jgi:septal ring factor EnvC (AmiA/AmiB activator)
VADLLQKQRRSEEERDAVMRDLESRQRSIRQQETNVAEMAARLDERSQRLTRLRSELDQTQSEILEQRLVIEEARAAFVRDATSPDAARARLEQARHDVLAYFERLRLQLQGERDKLDAAAVELSERQKQFRQDRAELEQYFVSREEELGTRFREEVLQEQERKQVQLQEQLERLQRQWQQDRMEAEQMIRQLIEQLTDRENQRGEAGSTGPAQAA